MSTALMERAYSVLEIKAAGTEDGKRIIRGIATTPSPDRMEDEVVPTGAKFKLPIPLLWQHDASKPIGRVTQAKVTKKGIEIVAEIEQDDEPGPLKDLLDFAWRSIVKRLVRGLSIGFRSLKSEDIEDSAFGIRFLEWEWLELSPVTIPANADASITAVKAHAHRAASGRVVRLSSPGASGSQRTTTRARMETMTYAEQIKELEATRAAKVAERAGIQEKAQSEGRTKDESEKESFDTLTDEIKALDVEIKDLRLLEAEAVEKAAPANGKTPVEAAKSRGTDVVVNHPKKLEPGIEFARFAMALSASEGRVHEARQLMELHYPQQVKGISVLKAAERHGGRLGKMLDTMITAKTAVAAGTTTDETWAGPLVQFQDFAGDFVEFLRPRTIIGRFGRDGIPDVRRIPFNVRIKGQTTGGSANWVGEGKAKPVTKFDFNATTHLWYKVAAITAITEDLIRFGDPSAERLVRDQIAETVIAKLDTDFIDPTVTAVSGVRPASITNGIVAVGSTGNSADDIRDDFRTMMSTALSSSNNLDASTAVLIMRPLLALQVGLLANAFGQQEFGSLNQNGGTLLGVPVITSNYAPASTVVLLIASEVYLSDDGMVSVDASREASLEMDTEPSHDANTPSGTSLVSMWQTNSVAFRAERFVNWSRRRDAGVFVLNSVTWGIPAGS